MKSNPPIFNIPAPVGWIVLFLVIVHVFRNQLAGQADLEFVYRFAFIPARYGENGFDIGGPLADYWSVLSYAFLHGDLVHLAVNCIWLVIFGSALARRFQAWRFLAMLVLGALGGAAMHYIAMPGDTSPMIGASASVSAIMAATLRFAFVAGGPLRGGRDRPGSYDIAAPGLSAVLSNRSVFGFIVLWFAVNFLMAIENGVIVGAGAGIAWQAHIGGFLAGFLLFPLLDRKSNQTQKASL